MHGILEFEFVASSRLRLFRPGNFLRVTIANYETGHDDSTTLGQILELRASVETREMETLDGQHHRLLPVARTLAATLALEVPLERALELLELAGVEIMQHTLRGPFYQPFSDLSWTQSPHMNRTWDRWSTNPEEVKSRPAEAEVVMGKRKRVVALDQDV